MNSLTGTEQRFVLAEIIKSSSVDVHALAGFVKSHSVTPDWYNMQLPNGRNLNQCIKFAQSLSIPGLPTHQPTPSHDEHAEQSISDYSRCHNVATSPLGQRFAISSAASGHFNILPRPANGVDGNSTSLSPTPKTLAKKRGRPSRSEISRRDLPPRLPPPIAPRPPLPTPGSNIPTPRTILPAMNRGFESNTPLTAKSPSSLGNGPRSRKKRRLNSPPTTPVVNETSTPPPPAAPSPPGAVSSSAKTSSNGQENGGEANNKTSTSDTP